MKKAVLALLLLIAPAAHSEPNIFQQFEQCASISNTYTHLATLASISGDDDKAVYQSYVKQIADRSQTKTDGDLVLALGDLAWAARGQVNAKSGAMAVYHDCIKLLGTST